ARDDDDRVAVDLVEEVLRDRVLLLEAVRGEVARDDDDVRCDLVRLRDRALEQARQEELLPAVQVGQLHDREGPVRPVHGRTLEVQRSFRYVWGWLRPSSSPVAAAARSGATRKV